MHGLRITAATAYVKHFEGKLAICRVFDWQSIELWMNYHIIKFFFLEGLNRMFIINEFQFFVSSDLVKKLLKNVKIKVDFSLSFRIVATQYSSLLKWLDSLLEVQCWEQVFYLFKFNPKLNSVSIFEMSTVITNLFNFLQFIMPLDINVFTVFFGL